MQMNQILEAFEKHPGDLFAAAKELSISPTVLLQKIRAMEHRPDNGVNYIICTTPPPKELGRAPLRRFIISVRHRNNPGWPLQDREAIERAREGYDRGLVDMYQGAEGPWIIQYARNRSRKDYRRQPWFTSEALA